jgi:3-hydroxyisobutyrate dehydrogenase-like beta-hydroxyacid dehydrogenase
MSAEIGFIGIGNMGSRMVSSILREGGAVVAYDRAPGLAASIGAREAESAAQVAREADVILLSLPDSKIIEAVMLGEDGLASHLRPGTVVVDLSTAATASTQRIHAVLLEKGVELIDAGVSGGAAAAAKGTLTLMVGGSAAALQQVTPVLDMIASKVFHMGESGAGHTAKLLNNFLNAVNLSASAEVLIAGKKAGLDVPQLLEVINSSSGMNWATQNRFPSIAQGDYLEGGLTSGLMMKDILLYVDHLREIGVPSLHASGPISAFGVALQTGRGGEISNRVVDALGDLAGGVRLHADPEE